MVSPSRAAQHRALGGQEMLGTVDPVKGEVKVKAYAA